MGDGADDLEYMELTKGALWRHPDPYVEGYNACKCGIDEYSNPYYSLSADEWAFYEWEDGYRDAERELEELKDV